MADALPSDSPEPLERGPAGPLFVPVRPGPSGCAARLFRTPPGARTAVGFTTERRLVGTLGPRQQWVRLSEAALRRLVEPVGVTTLTVDPQFAAPSVRSTPMSPEYGAVARTPVRALTQKGLAS
ncbi:SAV_915 family protein [Streptomyces boluensis]|uniref:SseB protein N-terminal domain-containing protein n=1 Tax=Streptomyces boluensis TaxID=1775135 RepID=A0A964ULW2_9ACTN|nr:SAV_915 family protein [Streptomyces boluensis]NBE50510.1 hypothetical protein [Streptomyces boluensis]